MRLSVLSLTVVLSSCAWKATGTAVLEGRGYSFRATPQAQVVSFDPAAGCEQGKEQEEFVLTQRSGADCRVLATQVYTEEVEWPADVAGGLKPLACEAVLDWYGAPTEKKYVVRRTSAGERLFSLQGFSLSSPRVEGSYRMLVLRDAERLRADPRWRSMDALRGTASTNDVDVIALRECGLWDEVAPGVVAREAPALEAGLAALPKPPTLAALLPWANRAERALTRLPDDPRLRAVAEKLLSAWQTYAFGPWPVPGGMSDDAAAAAVPWLEAYGDWKWRGAGNKSDLYPPEAFQRVAREVEDRVPQAFRTNMAQLSGRREAATFSAENGARDGALLGDAKLAALRRAEAAARAVKDEVSAPYFGAFADAAGWKGTLKECLLSSNCRTQVPSSLVDAHLIARQLRFDRWRLAPLMILADEGAAYRELRAAWASAAERFRADGALALAEACRVRAELFAPVVVNATLAEVLGDARVLGMPTQTSGTSAFSATLGPLDRRSQTQRRTSRTTEVVEERKPKDQRYYSTLLNLDYRIQQARTERVYVPGYTKRECRPGFDYCTDYKTDDGYKTGDDELVEQLLKERAAFVAEYEAVSRRSEAFERTETVTTYTLRQTLTVTVDGASRTVELTASSESPDLPRAQIAQRLEQAVQELLQARLVTPGPSTTKANAALEAKAREWLAKPYSSLLSIEATLGQHPFLAGHTNAR